MHKINYVIIFNLIAVSSIYCSKYPNPSNISSVNNFRNILNRQYSPTAEYGALTEKNNVTTIFSHGLGGRKENALHYHTS
jgi:hypothetical protein